MTTTMNVFCNGWDPDEVLKKLQSDPGKRTVYVNVGTFRQVGQAVDVKRVRGGLEAEVSFSPGPIAGISNRGELALIGWPKDEGDFHVEGLVCTWPNPGPRPTT